MGARQVPGERVTVGAGAHGEGENPGDTGGNLREGWGCARGPTRVRVGEMEAEEWVLVALEGGRGMGLVPSGCRSVNPPNRPVRAGRGQWGQEGAWAQGDPPVTSTHAGVASVGC